MPSHTLRSLRVLIVDDDPLIRTTFAEQLDSQRAITVVAAASGTRRGPYRPAPPPPADARPSACS